MDAATEHAEWAQRIEAEVEGELTLAERAALARHLMSCQHCAGTRASHLELRAAMAASAGNAHAPSPARPPMRRRRIVMMVLLVTLAGAVAGWLAHWKFGAPGRGPLEGGRATIVAP